MIHLHRGALTHTKGGYHFPQAFDSMAAFVDFACQMGMVFLPMQDGAKPHKRFTSHTATPLSRNTLASMWRSQQAARLL
jgi:hypothetical protein